MLWVSHVVQQVCDGALASGQVLSPEAQVGNHGKAAVPDLILLVLLVQGRVAAGQTEGVEVLAT